MSTEQGQFRQLQGIVARMERLHKPNHPDPVDMCKLVSVR